MCIINVYNLYSTLLGIDESWDIENDTYVLPYGQMSLWGRALPHMLELDRVDFYLSSKIKSNDDKTVKVGRLRGQYRIGPHNKDILSIIFGSLLGDAHAERRTTGGTRICFQQEHSHRAYIL